MDLNLALNIGTININCIKLLWSGVHKNTSQLTSNAVKDLFERAGNSNHLSIAYILILSSEKIERIVIQILS